MGFGFNLLFVLIILPISGILIILWATTQKKLFGELLGLIWVGMIGLVILISILQIFTTKKRVKKPNIYGEYIIDRSKFPGEQANWQYENFRFEITKRKELIFHQTAGRKTIASDTAKIEFLEQYVNDRIRIKKDSSMHHIIEEEPTLYRSIWSFYYVFESPKFGNVFFKKGKWKPIK
jgi:hypothetical protein